MLLSENKKTVFQLIFADGRKVSAAFDICYESDNELKFDDPNYEEFISIVMRNTDAGELFEFNYHNMPIDVYSENKKIIL